MSQFVEIKSLELLKLHLQTNQIHLFLQRVMQSNTCIQVPQAIASLQFVFILKQGVLFFPDVPVGGSKAEGCGHCVW